MDVSQIVSMAKDCGCFKIGRNGDLVVCEKCAKAASGYNKSKPANHTITD